MVSLYTLYLCEYCYKKMFVTSKNANHQYKAKYLKRLRRSLAFIKIKPM